MLGRLSRILEFFARNRAAVKTTTAEEAALKAKGASDEKDQEIDANYNDYKRIRDEYFKRKNSIDGTDTEE